MFTLHAAFVCLVGFMQPTSDSPLAPPPDGPRHADATYHLLTNATIHIRPGESIVGGGVAIRDGRILQVFEDVVDHPGARVWDCEGLHIYAGFIDPFVEIEAPVPPDENAMHWNGQVMPQRRALEGEGLSDREAESLRKIGFVAAGLSPENGVFRGRGAVISLAESYSDASQGRPPVYADGVYSTVSFATGGFGGGYPTSQMGAIALMRQTLIDADWRTEHLDGAPSALDALDRQTPMLFVTRDELEALRAGKIAREFDRDAILLGSGDEYKRFDAIVRDGLPIILPIDFPDAPDVSTIGREDGVELETLMAWEHAPYNPRRLDEAGMPLALTTRGSGGSFLDNLRTAVEHGLAEDSALAMLTINAADMLGVEDMLGSVAEGMVASLVVTDGPLFAKKTKIRDVWIDGRRHEVTAAPEADLAGVWRLDDTKTLVIGSKNAVSLEREGEDPIKARNVKRNGDHLTLVIDIESGAALVSAVVDGDDMLGTKRWADGHVTSWTATRVGDAPAEEKDDEVADPIAGVWNMTAFNNEMFGPDGVPFTLTITRDEEGIDVEFEAAVVAAVVESAAFDDGLLTAMMIDVVNEDRFDLSAVVTGNTARGQTLIGDGAATLRVEGEREEAPAIGVDEPQLEDMPELPGYPFGPFALAAPPEQRSVVFTNATIWTSGPDGIMSGWLAIAEGKIVGLGAGEFDVSLPGEFDVIDVDSAHITPGIIDCHSHTGMSRGLNESGQAVTAEVRVGDITDPDRVNWYRQLAGGVTTVNNLHGSANPIGGQSQTNKIRWGAVHPDDMHMEDATPGIKFALGENVKQSNWSNPSGRYPQTRMGVEALIRDRFVAAGEYADRDDVRRDLELEALAEILAGERLIHCHSYRQDEILMLCRIAEEFGFTIGSFQHVLEGYKVAEAIKEHSYGGSSFSDWWAYKVEVQDAIPHNGAIMHDVGVTVSFNSDSDELARRLNTEAAKAVRYGGVSPEEAFKFVTINPAKQLGIADRVGSIELGKDADLAIWSGNPLSTMVICQETWIDGRQYFSLARDLEHRERNASERTRLLQSILSKGAKKAPKDTPARSDAAPERLTVAHFRERQMTVAVREHYLDLLQQGLNPADHRCGDCGTSVIDLFANER